MAQQYSLRTANFAGGKALGILIDLKCYAHCICLLLTESLIMITLENDDLHYVFLLCLILAGRERDESATTDRNDSNNISNSNTLQQ